MDDLRTRIELTKLARELDVDEDRLAFLAQSPAEELRELRRVTGEALFRRHEARVRMLASISSTLPLGVTAKIAEGAMGASLSARIAGVMEPANAARLAGLLSPEFLTELAIRIDPVRVGPIIALLPRTDLIDVAHRLIAADELITLARFVAIVDPELALAVVEATDGPQLLQVLLYCDDDAAVAELVRRLPDSVLADALSAAEDDQEREAVQALLAAR